MHRVNVFALSILLAWSSLTAESPDGPTIRDSEEITAEDRAFWSFQPLPDTAIPTVGNTDSVRTPVDAFLLEKLEAKGLAFFADADPVTLVRRTYLDLVGLLPTLEEVDQFLAERDQTNAAEAYEALIDRLLGSKHYGERWGRHWLDVAGYVDVYGSDENAPSVRVLSGKFKYRDYVIRSFNTDKPFNRFLTEQLAGDELVDWREAESFTPEIRELLVATGFLRLAIDDTDQGVLNIPPNRHAVLYDTMQQLGTSVFGLTVNCAQCHSHKFDPIPQRDYYQLMSLITPAYNPQKWVQLNVRSLPDASPKEQARIKQYNAAIKREVAEVQKEMAAVHEPFRQQALDGKIAQLPEQIRADTKQALATPKDKRNPVQAYLVAKFGAVVTPKDPEIRALLSEPAKAKTGELDQKIAGLRGKKKGWGQIEALYDTGPPQKRNIFVRGNFLQNGDEVEPGFPSILSEPGGGLITAKTPDAKGNTSGRRLALAQWATRPGTRAGGLVARVMVNRIWHHLFGKGIVATPGNLGIAGAPPTHPELLDWLAGEFVQGGWRIKPMIKLLVMSTAYRQASAIPSGGAVPAADPENKLLWRMPLRRLQSEIVRDSVLCASGKLDREMYGPPIPQKILPGDKFVIATEGLATPTSQWRRSMYLLGRRNYNLSFLSVFDHPSITINCQKRNSSPVVLQSLAMLNDEFVLEQTEFFASRVLAAAAAGKGDPIELAYRMALARRPSPREVTWSQELLDQHSASLKTDDDRPQFANGRFGQGLALRPARTPTAGADTTIDDNGTFNFGGDDFTIQLWVNFNTLDGEQVIVEKFGPGDGGPGWTLTKLGNQNLMFHGTGGFGTLLGSSRFTAGTWHHVVARRRGDTAELIVDGSSIARTNVIGKRVSDSRNGLLFGKRNDGDGRGFFFDGTIDDVAIWNHALSDDEIATLRSAEVLSNVDDGLIGYWPLNGNGNDASGGARGFSNAEDQAERNALAGLCHVLLNTSQFLYVE